jgi:hypothetical protein
LNDNAITAIAGLMWKHIHPWCNPPLDLWTLDNIWKRHKTRPP